MRVDETVRRETRYIAIWVAVISVLMEAVFLLLRRWNLTVLWGNLLGGFIAVLNFFLMGLGVQKAVDQEEKDAKTTMRVSQTGRTMMLFVAAGLGILLDAFHPVAVILPLLFPRIAVAFRPKFDKKS